MITEEEFEIFQQNMNMMRQENFQLKDQYEELCQQMKDFQEKKDQLASLEKQREESRNRHNESLQAYRDELAKLQKQAAEQQERNTKEMNEKVNELNEKLSVLNKQIKEKEDENDKIKGRIKLYDNRLHQVNADIDKAKRREKKFRPTLEFLRMSRSIPMYLEDLNMKIYKQKAIYQKNISEISELENKLADIEKRDQDVNLQTIDKTGALQAEKARLKKSAEHLEEAIGETKKLQRALDDAKSRFQNAKSMTEKTIIDRKEMTEKYKATKAQLEAEYLELQKVSDENKEKLNEIQGESAKEIAAYDKKIKEARKKITMIRDNGIDPDNPSVDHDLESQIVKVIQEKKEMEKQIALIEDEIKDLDKLIVKKDEDLQTLTLKMKPTPKILSDPEFQERQILLEELVFQNKTLRDTFMEMANRIQKLKIENENIRKDFRNKMEK